MNRENRFDGLQLQDNLFINDKVHPITTLQLDTLVDHWQVDLIPKWNCTKLELVTQALTIRRLKEAGTERAMNFSCRGNHFITEVFVKNQSMFSVFSVPPWFIILIFAETTAIPA